MNDLKEVYFDQYCKYCKHESKKEIEQPCFECLQSAANIDSHKPVNFVDSGKTVGDYESLRKIKDYLYDIYYDRIDYAYAKVSAGATIAPSCSSIRNGQFFGRNLDWFYNANSEFVVHVNSHNNRYASVGIAGGLSDPVDYKLLPFRLYDGINECGVTASMNVVPLDKGGNDSRPLYRHVDTVSAVSLVRYILDHFNSARQAVRYIRDYVHVVFPEALHDYGYELHYLIADEFETYVLEFIDHKAVAKRQQKYITNFYTSDVIFNPDGTVYTPETKDEYHNAIVTNLITPHGSGLERYNYICENYSSANTKEGMRELLNGLTYTKAYITSPNPSYPYWYTEFVDPTRGLTVANDISDYAHMVEVAGQYYIDRSRDDGGKTWQTVHSSIYDIDQKKLYLIVQEDGKELSFSL